MNREGLKELSQLRIREAKTLLANQFYDGAYYLCGYSVECALKACIAKNTKQYDFPDKKVVIESHTHEIIKLVKIAGLEIDLKNNLTDPKFQLNWNLVKDWSEISRYKRNSELEALDLYSAITARKHGIMTWIKRHW
ncbi:HEPN domain-containing protein [Cyclobacterium sp.]|uniref:HEPN domain-containing protein n=1 Tax=Cyclobacterium sp. TaxID=1966343 RepID=UPI0019942099|nr:HEPN domain-containing protein [Cyclobacterium sp.]MBD3628195.1 HEPN domain-containing protein [Cyclobacterium sp.]